MGGGREISRFLHMARGEESMDPGLVVMNGTVACVFLSDPGVGA